MIRPLFAGSYAGPRRAAWVRTGCRRCRRLRLPMIHPLLGERAGVRADVASNISGSGSMREHWFSGFRDDPVDFCGELGIINNMKHTILIMSIEPAANFHPAEVQS